MKRIEDDDRHMSMRVLVEINGGDRLFPGWSMGFVDPATHATKIAKIWPEIEQIVATEGSTSEAVTAALRGFNQR